MNKVSFQMKIGNILLLVVLFSCSSASFANDLENYIRKLYLKPDRIYTYKPVNRYHFLGEPKIFNLLEEKEKSIYATSEYISLCDGLYFVQAFPGIVLKKIKQDVGKVIPPKILKKIESSVAKENKRFVSDIIYEKFIETNKGNFIFYRIDKLDKESKDFTVEDFLDTDRWFLHSFVFVTNDMVYSPEIKIEKEDPETGGYTRNLWDIFTFNNQEYILIFNRVYERHDFEVFKINKNKLIKELEFSFGGL